MRRWLNGGTVLCFSLLAACAGQRIPPAMTGADIRPVDEPCNPSNGTLPGSTRLMRLDPIEFPVPSRWIPDFKSPNDVDFNLQRTGAALHVWKGSEFIFTPVLPVNTVECELSRGDTTITIRSTRLVEGITSYRVDVRWKPQIGGQYLYMQLLTRFPEHLREVRGVIEGVRFPARTASR